MILKDFSQLLQRGIWSRQERKATKELSLLFLLSPAHSFAMTFFLYVVPCLGQQSDLAARKKQPVAGAVETLWLLGGVSCVAQ